MLEIILIMSGFVWLSPRISPFITTTSFQWFILTLLCVYLTTIPLRGLKKKKIHYQYSETELLDQYLSHCQFFITKRKMVRDIPLTQQDYLRSLKKKHRLYRKLYPIVMITLLVSFVIFMTSFQVSIFIQLLWICIIWFL